MKKEKKRGVKVRIKMRRKSGMMKERWRDNNIEEKDEKV